MHRFTLTRSLSAQIVSHRLNQTISCLGSVRFQSGRARRKSKREGANVPHTRDRRRERNNGAGGGQRRGPPRMVYYVQPEPPAPPKFNLTTLGIGWTKPSQPISKHPAVKEVIKSGRLPTNPLVSEPQTNGHRNTATESKPPSIPVTTMTNQLQTSDPINQEKWTGTPETSVLNGKDASTNHAADVEAAKSDGEIGSQAVEALYSEDSMTNPSTKVSLLQPSSPPNQPSTSGNTRWWDAIKPKDLNSNAHGLGMPEESQSTAQAIKAPAAPNNVLNETKAADDSSEAETIIKHVMMEKPKRIQQHQLPPPEPKVDKEECLAAVEETNEEEAASGVFRSDLTDDSAAKSKDDAVVRRWETDEVVSETSTTEGANKAQTIDMASQHVEIEENLTSKENAIELSNSQTSTASDSEQKKRAKAVPWWKHI